MRPSLIGLLAISAVTISGCNLDGSGGNHSGSAQAPTGSSASSGVLGFLRPRPDQATINRMHEEDAVRQQKADEAAAKLLKEQQAQQQQNNNNGSGGGFDIGTITRMLPKVSTDPIAPPAEEVANDGMQITPASATNPQAASSPAQIAHSSGANPPAPPVVASYGGYGSPPPPPGGLIPPPPAVSLSTQVSMPPAPPPYADPNNPYANPYMQGGYGMPYQQQQMPMQGQMAPSRPSGSPFASGGKAASDSGNEEEDRAAAERAKKLKDFVPITPVGMEALSPYKQRDDLRVLWKGALSTSAMQDVAQSKMGDQVQHIDVALPNGASKGAFAVDQHTLNNLFGANRLDPRIAPAVHKAELDVTQAYYRYLYTYNRFSLAQQTVAARKQEVDVAGSASESQRAAADLSQAQQDVDSTKDDMHQAMNELATAAGKEAARTIIGHVSHVTPSSDSLVASQPQQAAGEEKGGFLHFPHFGRGDAANAEPPVKAAKVDAKDSKKKDKEKPAKKSKEKDKAGDLSPSPASLVSSMDTAAASDPGAPPAPAAASVSPDGISFELKGVNVTPRKSVLTVAIRNSGSNNYSFSPSDAFSISEGNHKISEAAVRADFDTTLVQPNQEVKGTITIFGRPWSDKLAVVMSDGGKAIALRRQ
ncbi:MAG TPA: TolC family protein [Planktothrix sp.]|jgi:hypothetical protein